MKAPRSLSAAETECAARPASDKDKIAETGKKSVASRECSAFVASPPFKQAASRNPRDGVRVPCVSYGTCSKLLPRFLLLLFVQQYCC